METALVTLIDNLWKDLDRESEFLLILLDHQYVNDMQLYLRLPSDSMMAAERLTCTMDKVGTGCG